MMDKDKGQKIIAAIYLATNHLSDSDPLKKNLRQKSIELIDLETQVQAAHAVEMMLGAAVLARAVSDKNASIISFEVLRFVTLFGGQTEESVSQMFLSHGPQVTGPNHLSSRASLKHSRPLSEISKSVSVKDSIENKTKRHDAILSFINTRKSAAIKDIAALFPELSEKTIQRELGALVSSGKISKRGSKRWSVYMAVGA